MAVITVTQLRSLFRLSLRLHDIVRIERACSVHKQRTVFIHSIVRQFKTVVFPFPILICKIGNGKTVVGLQFWVFAFPIFSFTIGKWENARFPILLSVLLVRMGKWINDSDHRWLHITSLNTYFLDYFLSLRLSLRLLNSDWDLRSAKKTEKWSRFSFGLQRFAETKLLTERSLNPKLIKLSVDFACTRC